MSDPLKVLTLTGPGLTSVRQAPSETGILPPAGSVQKVTGMKLWSLDACFGCSGDVTGGRCFSASLPDELSSGLSGQNAACLVMYDLLYMTCIYAVLICRCFVVSF